MTITRLGLHFASTSYEGIGPRELFPRIRDGAQAAEQSGFDSLWVPDHLMQNDVGGGRRGPMLEAYSLLSALAATTERALLGALVSPVTLRNPALLAKTVTSLDVISSGRAILGIGAAWDTEEHQAYGVSFPEIGEREDRLEEAVAICRAMLGEESPSWTGAHYSIDTAFNFPRPIQASIPILVGGGGERRTLGIVARYADACNVFGDAGALRHKLDVLEEHCAAIGRSSSEITKTCGLFAPASVDELCDAIGERLEAGAEGVIVLANNCPTAETIQAWGEAASALFS